jgi:hypothetical protein
LGVLPEGYIYPKAERAVRDLLRKRAHVTVQVVKTGITPQLAPADRLREVETVPLHPAGRLHTLQ